MDPMKKNVGIVPYLIPEPVILKPVNYTIKLTMQSNRKYLLFYFRL